MVSNGWTLLSILLFSDNLKVIFVMLQCIFDQFLLKHVKPNVISGKVEDEKDGEVLNPAPNKLA